MRAMIDKLKASIKEHKEKFEIMRNTQTSLENFAQNTLFLTFAKFSKLIFIFFIISTSFFIYQHSTSLSWDFNSYVLNGRYWFANGSYFELLRPPLMPLIISLFSFLGWRAAEFVFIILTSLSLMYSSIRLAKALTFNSTVFYAISLNLSLLNMGLVNGTELLSLVFLELFISLLIENNSLSGFFLAFSVLSRYTSLALLPLVFLHLSIKKIFKSLLAFGATLSLWFFYNYYKSGNFFTSLADQYANNILYRGYLMQPIQLAHFLQVQNVLIPFFALGVLLALYTSFKYFISSKKLKLSSLLGLVNKLKIEIIMFFLLFSSISSYYIVPIKSVRYLFNLVLPTFYFSYIGIIFLIKKYKKFKERKQHEQVLLSVALIIFILNLSLVLIQLPQKEYETPEMYHSAINSLNHLNLSTCSVMSNSWIILSYLERPSLPFPRFELVNDSLAQGQILVFFKHVPEPDYVKNGSFIQSLPIITENKDYVIVGSPTCLPIAPFDDTYLQQVDGIIFNLQGYHINQNPCFILFHTSPFLESACNFINLKGFKQDEYRAFQ